jgi:hypothetical protein
VSESGGLLRIRGPVDPACGTSAAFEGALPGAASVRARFAFEVPPPCASYGVTVGTDAARFPLDYVYLGVALDDLAIAATPPAMGAARRLRLRLFGEPETGAGGPVFPVVASTLLSDWLDPATDPALAGVTSIELSLDLEPDVAGQIPAAGYRLCTASGCPAVFTPLGPPSLDDPQDVISVCGNPLSAFGTSANGGRVDSREVLGAALLATPEPAGGTGALGAALALAALAWRARAGALG